MQDRYIPTAVIRRLPRYYRYLRDLKDSGVERISSGRLSEIMGVTASQIRQDLNHFGGFGQQGYGYNTGYLYNEIGELLGLNEHHGMILIGAGNLGEAVIGYINSRGLNHRFIAAFDIDSRLFGTRIADVPVLPMSELKSFVEENGVDIVALTVPAAAAVETAGLLVDSSIRAVWNFAHVDLPLPDTIIVEDVHLLDSLMRLTYSLHAGDDKDHGKH